MNAPITLEQLVAARIIAKRQEDEASTHRKELDQQIAALVKPQLQEGKKTFSTKLPDGLKLTVSFGVNRKVDTESLQTAWANLPIEVQQTFKWKAEVSESAYGKLVNSPLKTASKFITTTDASPSVKLEVA